MKNLARAGLMVLSMLLVFGIGLGAVAEEAVITTEDTPVVVDVVEETVEIIDEETEEAVVIIDEEPEEAVVIIDEEPEEAVVIIDEEPEEAVEIIDEEEPDEDEVIDIEEEEVPLGVRPTITVTTRGAINAMRVGDKLEMDAKLIGFDNIDYTLQWQIKKDGSWLDIANANDLSLCVTITEDNADCAWRLTASIAA